MRWIVAALLAAVFAGAQLAPQTVWADPDVDPSAGPIALSLRKYQVAVRIECQPPGARDDEVARILNQRCEGTGGGIYFDQSVVRRLRPTWEPDYRENVPIWGNRQYVLGLPRLDRSLT